MLTGARFPTPEAALSSNRDDPNANLFSKLDLINSYRTPDSQYHMMLSYPELNFRSNEWVQSSNPTLEPGLKAQDYFEIYASLKAPESEFYLLRMKAWLYPANFGSELKHII